jgi:hypothetical protein
LLWERSTALAGLKPLNLRAERLRILVDHDLSGLHNFLDLFEQLAKIGNAEHPKYAIYYSEVRSHVSLGKDAPCTRPIQRFGGVVAHPILGGLHHRYA